MIKVEKNRRDVAIKNATYMYENTAREDNMSK